MYGREHYYFVCSFLLLLLLRPKAAAGMEAHSTIEGHDTDAYFYICTSSNPRSKKDVVVRNRMPLWKSPEKEKEFPRLLHRDMTTRKNHNVIAAPDLLSFLRRL